MTNETNSGPTTRPENIADLKITVIGAGLMGHSIAGNLAFAGGNVTIFDSQPAALNAAPGRIRDQLINLGRDASVADRIGLAGELEAAVAGADLVMEAVPERLELKQQLFTTIANILPDAVLATNTSVLRIGEVFANIANPDRAVGTHWWNPPHLVPVVEVVQSEHTGPDIALWMIEILRQAGKVPIHVRKDVPGFIGNRLQHALWREAISLVDNGVCDAQTIDLLVRNSFGLRLAAMGPIENADYVGLDLTLAVQDYLFPSLDRDTTPSQRLRHLVAEGHLGAKTGSGFLQWEPGDREAAGGAVGTAPDQPAHDCTPSGSRRASQSAALMNVNTNSLAVEAIWTPDPQRAENSRIANFTRWLATERAVPLTDPLDYQALWRWSVEHLEEFWAAVWDFFHIHAHSPGNCVLTSRSMPGARWFPGATLNYVEHALRDSRSTEPALITIREDGRESIVTWDDLRHQVASVAAGLRQLGVSRGDRVVGYLPNGSHAIVAFLATASVGAIWSQCGQDYGAPAAIDRFAQLSPKVLFAADGYQFNGRIYDRREETGRLRDKLPSLTHTVLVGNLFEDPPTADNTTHWDDLARLEAPLLIEPVPFDHPLWVLFSSGTTGKPKGIVHGHGGVLLEHLVVNGLHFNLGPDDRFFWYTTTNWMMWNLLTSGLLTGSTVITYDGSPTYPDPGLLWRLVERHRATVFGTSPGHLEASAKAGLNPGVDLDLSHLTTLGSTGATLPASSYQWVHDHVGTGVQVASISGGTDVVGLFAGSAPTTPVYAGELSARCLGVAAESWSPTGTPQVDEVGELVITRPMPSMPLGFWNDTDGTRYRESYFNVYPGIWRHGDWVTITTRGTIIFHGRSDSTLNRHGVRLGSAEIYEAVSTVPQVKDSLILGIDETDGGYWMPLFVVLNPGSTLDQTLRDAIKKAIKDHASPRHVPDDIIPVTALPHTRTGKKLEVPIKRLFQGAELNQVVDPGAVDDPSALEELSRLATARRTRQAERDSTVVVGERSTVTQ